MARCCRREARPSGATQSMLGRDLCCRLPACHCVPTRRPQYSACSAVQEAHPLAVHKAAAVGGSRRQRGVGAWAVGLPEVVAVPEGQAGAELAVVLEFLQARGGGGGGEGVMGGGAWLAAGRRRGQQQGLGWQQAGVCRVPAVNALPPPAPPNPAPSPRYAPQVFGPKLQMRATCLAAFAAELLQPAVGGDVQPLCPSAEESLVGAVHCRLLEVVS